MRSARFTVLSSALGLAGICSILSPQVLAQDAADNGGTTAGIYRGATTAVRFDVSPPLRLMRSTEPAISEEEEVDDERPSGLEGPLGPQDLDPLVQAQIGINAVSPPRVVFDAQSNVNLAIPPDPNGDVGPNHVVTMSNLSFAVFDKNGTLLLGPLNNNTLWAGFGGDCQTENSGDPIVVYGAGHWFLSQFTSSGPTFFNCVAVSTTDDPTGTYFRYAFSTGNNFPDYPKYGLWSDALYIATREFRGSPSGPFAGVGAYAINLSQIIAGVPNPTMISFLAPPGAQPYNIGDGLLPADLDGTTPPPAGSPNFYLGSMDNGGPYGAPQDALTFWKYHADFVVPANSTFTLTSTLPVAAFDSQFPCGAPGSRACIPQPGTSVKIDHLGYRQRPLWRLAYRNFGTHESLVTNQSVEAAPNISGIRWYEIRDPNGAPQIFQQGTYAPGTTDGIHRWMGSIAMDAFGNAALGYSASSSTTRPSIWYTGRLAEDALGTMPQGEESIVDGVGSQTHSSNRWGDYTSLNVDPVDDCTFWYVNEWYPVTSQSGWQVRVGAFSLECPVHVGDLDNQSINNGARWIARVNIQIHHAATEQAVTGATVTVNLQGIGSRTCVTDSFGACRVQVSVPDTRPQVRFTVTNVSAAGYTYDAAGNHDPDGDSNGTTIVVLQP
jgi:hypothetical protein